MVLDLPSPDRSQLARSPLELTVCQVRFEQTLALADPRIALNIHEALGGPAGAYPRMDQIKAPSFQVALSSEGTAETQPLSGVGGWRFQSEEGGWIVSLMTDFVALETTRYTTWEADFGPRMGQLLAALAASVNPVLEERLGLRYVDRLSGLRVDSSSDWARYVDTTVLGVLRHPTLGPAVITTQQQLELNLGGDARCILRHGNPTGVDEDGLRSYVLDYDVSRQAARPFEVEGIKDALEGFSDASLQLFHLCLNSDYLTSLRTGDTPMERAAEA